MSYLNRHLLHNPSIHSMGQEMAPPPRPMSEHNKSPSPAFGANTVTSVPQDYNTASTIKYCSSNGLEILPPQSQHAYVIQQCPSSSSSEPVIRVSGQVQVHEDQQQQHQHQQQQQHMETHHQLQNLNHQSSVMSSGGPSSSSETSANHGSSGGQLEVVHYAGVPGQRKKDTASPISSAGSTSPSEEQLPPDTTKKSNNTRRPEKPNMSYINMIACAIKESPDRMLTLNGIYNYLQQK